MNKHSLYIIFAVLLFVEIPRADVHLPAIFGSNMVLQRNQILPVWGFASPGEKIRVEFNGQKKSCLTDSQGRWNVNLDSIKEGGPFEMKIVGNNIVVFRNILIGEVWLCSGQSNMEFALEKTDSAKQELSKADYPAIRLFTVKRTSSDITETSIIGSWNECSPKTAARFSGVAYYFGKRLHQQLNIPVGLIQSSWGGTAAESWTPKQILKANQNFQSILRKWDSAKSVYPEVIKAFDLIRDSLMERWKKDSLTAFAEGKAFPPRPQEPRGGPNTIQHMPSGLFNGMIAPLIPFAIKGVIWYQGEANAARAHQYRELFPAMINSWRDAWKSEFPFYFVQLPNLFRQPEPSKSGWAELRESQLMTLSMPKTAMAVTIDIGDPKDLHPKNKRDVGMRLALLAEKNLYGENFLIAESPLFSSHKIEKNSIRIFFTPSDSKLVACGNKLEGFMIAGEDKQFIDAEATIENNTVLVSNKSINNPVAVRYAWGDNPVVTLFNQAGFPASPFRTDDWKEVTFGKK